MEQLIRDKKQILGEVQVPNEKTQKEKTNEHLAEYRKEGRSEKLQRILAEYEFIQNYQYGETLYFKTIQ